MGDFNVMDMITRLPITPCDEVTAICVPKCKTEFLDFRRGTFNEVSGVRMVQGHYGGYCDVTKGDERFSFDQDGMEAAFFMKNSTVEFIEKEYDGREIWHEQAEEEKTTLSIYMRNCKNQFIRDMYGKYGRKAVEYAFECEHERQSHGEYVAFERMLSWEKLRFPDKYKEDREKIPDERKFEDDAKLHVLLYQKINWFCLENRVSPFTYDFEKYCGQGLQRGDFDRARRFAKFIEDECNARIEEYDKEWVEGE